MHKTERGLRPVLAVLMSSLALVGAAGIVQDVPPVSEDGWYELGDADCAAGLLPFSAFTELGYVAWGKLTEAGLPADAKIRFVGGILLDALPSGHVYDFSRLRYLAYVKANVFPTGYRLTVPAECWFRFRGADVTPDYVAGTFTLVANAAEQAKGYLADIEMNGKMSGSSADGAPTVYGRFTGTGSLSLSNFYTAQTFAGEFDFAGTLTSGTQQNGNNFTIRSPLSVSHLGTWTAYMSNPSTQNLYYFPQREPGDPPCTLVVTNVCSGWGAVSVADEKVSCGVGVFVHSGNTVKINQVTYKDLYLVADTTGSGPAFDKGVGNVEIGLFGSSSDGKICPSPNINLKVGFHNDGNRKYTVDYCGWTSAVNVCTLDLTPRSGWGSVTVVGTTPANLPRHAVCAATRTNSVTNRLTAATWTMPFDFGVSNLGEINAARCETMGVLTYPAAGTVVLTNTTALAGVPPVEGDYPILLGTSGGDGLANWTVRLAGDWDGIAVEPIVGPTGLVVRVRQAPTASGMLTVIRPWTNTVDRTVERAFVRADWTVGEGTKVRITDVGRVEFAPGATRLPEITLDPRSTLTARQLMLTNAATATVNFNGGTLARTGFNQRFFDCTNDEGRIVFRSVDARPIELNLASQWTCLAPQRGMLAFEGRGGVLFRGSGINNQLQLKAADRVRVNWNQLGGVRLTDNVQWSLTGEESLPLGKPISLDAEGTSVDFAGRTSEMTAIHGVGCMTNSSTATATVRFGRDNADVVLSAVLPKRVLGAFVFEKLGVGTLVADRDLPGGLELSAGALAVVGGTRESPFAPSSLCAAAGTTITVDGGALQLPDDAQLADGVRISCRKGGIIRNGARGAWRGADGFVCVISGGKSVPDPAAPVDVTTAWRSVGPGGGGYIQTVQPSRHSAERLMVGCDVGGFYISEDGGRHYEMRNDGLREMWVETIAEHPTDPDTLIVGGYSLYKSTDRGRTWVEKRTGLPAPQSGSFACLISKVAYDPDDAMRVYAAAGSYRNVSGHDDQHLYVSSNGGESWMEVVAAGQFPSGAYVLDLAVDPRNGRHLVASTAKGIYISTDGGIHWAASNAGLPAHLRTRKLAMAPGNPDIMYVTVRQKAGEKPFAGGIYKSTDGGATWTAKNTGLDQHTGTAGTSDMNCSSYGPLVVDPHDASVVYAGGCTYWTSGIWKSVDGGETWTHPLQKGAVELEPQGWLPFDGALDMSISTLALSSLGDSPLYFGTAFAVWRSDDGGANWSQRYTERQADGTFASAGLEVICGTTVLPDPHQRGRVYLGYLDVGAFVTTNGGVSMVRNSLPRDLSCYSLALSPTEPGLVWGTFGSETARRRIMVSRDGLRSWMPTIPEGEEPDWLTAQESSLVCVNSSAPYRLAVIVANRGVALSADGGAHWEFVPESALPDGKSASTLEAVGGVLYAGVKTTVVSPGRLWKSTDGGATWTLVTDDAMSVGDIQHVRFDGNRILLSARSNYSSTLNRTRFGGCWLSEDGGTSWRRIVAENNAFDAVFAGRWIAVALASNDYYDHFNDNSRVMISKDAGATWRTLRDATLKNPQVFSLAVDPFDKSVLWATSHGNATFVRRLPDR